MLRKWNFEILLAPKADLPIYLQIADAIIEAIKSGRLKPSEPIPGSRTLASRLGVNRNTLVEALQVLVHEGWLETKERKGTFVSKLTTEGNPVMLRSGKPHINTVEVIEKTYISLDDGYPDSKIAPITELARAYRQIFARKARWQMMGYGGPMGDPEFRQEIVQMLNHQRGLILTHEELCITRGSQMAMYLLAQCLIEKGDCVMVENPGYQPAWKAFEHAGASLIPIDVDKDGICVEEIEQILINTNRVKAIYLTPHRQYPTTVTLSLARRMALVKLSNQYGFWIVEDDYDNEFHFGYRPILPLSSYIQLQRFVYIGTLSKVVAPALRLGYLACKNMALLGRMAELRKIIDVQSDHIMEQALLQLLRDGTLKRHIRKSTLHYIQKRDFVSGLLNSILGDKIDYTTPDGGLAFWIVPKSEPDWEKLTAQLKSKGIQIVGPERYSFAKPVNGIRIGYAALSIEHLEEAFKQLDKLLTY